ncbi:MAG: hypothetical protein Q9180_004748, partial [Flavoplaca navasiana]
EDRKAMLLRLYNEIVPLQDSSKARRESRKGIPNGDATNACSDVEGQTPDGARMDHAPDGGNDLQAILDATSDEEVEADVKQVD